MPSKVWKSSVHPVNSTCWFSPRLRRLHRGNATHSRARTPFFFAATPPRRGSVTCQVASVPIPTKLESPSNLECSLRASGACTAGRLSPSRTTLITFFAATPPQRGSVTCQVASIPILTKLESPSKLECSLRASGACVARMLRILGTVPLRLHFAARPSRRGSVTCQVASVPIPTKLESPSKLEGSLRASGACGAGMLRILGRELLFFFAATPPRRGSVTCQVASIPILTKLESP